MMHFVDFLLGNKRFNIKALAVLIVTPLVFGAGLYFLHAFQVKRNAEDLKAIALQLENEGQIAQALNVLDQYLGMAPTDNEALIKFGTLMAKDAKSRKGRERAMMALEQALRRDPKQTEVRRKVAELAISLGDYNAARDHLDVLDKEFPNDADVLHLYGRCEAGANKLEKAEEWFQKAIKVAPKRADIAVDYAFLLRLRKQPIQANDEVKRLIAADENASAARLLAARYYFRFYEFAPAEEHIDYAMEKLKSNSEETYLLAAEIFMVQLKLDKAQEILVAGIKAHPADGHLRQKQAQVKLALGNPKEALALLRDILAKLPDDPDELYNLANLLIDAGGLEEAEKVIVKVSVKMAAPQVDYLKARVQMSRDSWGEARQTLEAALPKLQPRAPFAKQVYLLLAACYRVLGNNDKWLECCNEALQRDPSWPPAHLALADYYAAQGKLDQVLIEYAQVPRTPDVLLKDVGLQLTRILRLPEKDRRWKDLDDLVGELRKLPLKDQQKMSLELIEASVLVAQKKQDDARKKMETERDRDPKQIDPWLFLIQLAELQERTKDAETLLADAELAVGPRVDWELARLRQELKKDNTQTNKALENLEKKLGKFPKADADRLRAILADSYQAVGEDGKAQAFFEALAENQPKNLGVRQRLLERYYQQKEADKLARVIKEVRAIEGINGAMTYYGEALQHMLRHKNNGDANALADARFALEKAGKLRPSWSRVPLLEAEAFEAEILKATHKNVAEKLEKLALEKYELALKHGEGRLATVRRTLELMYNQKRFADAAALLAKLSEKGVELAGLERFAAQLVVVNAPEAENDQKRAFEKGFKMAMKAVNKDSKDYRDWIWLGQLAFLAKDRLRAEYYFRRAVQIDDSSPDTWATLIFYLIRVNNNKKAEIELKIAENKLPADKATLLLAPAYEAMGDMGRAEERLMAALSANAKDTTALRDLAGFQVRTGKIDKADESLRKLLAPQTNAPKETVIWARRTLALTLAVRGGYQRFQEAQGLVKGNLAEMPNSMEDQLAHAIVLSTQPAFRQDAIKACENLGEKMAVLRPEMHYFLAQLYEADGNWKLAKIQLLLTLNTQDKNPIVLVYYASALLRHNEIQAAEKAVKDLAKVAEDAWQTLELRARVLQAQEKTDDARNAVLEYVTNNKKDARLELAGLLLDELGHPDDAEQQLRDFVVKSTQPEAVLVLAQVLGKHKKVDEALSLCEAAMKKAPPERVVYAAVVVLRAGKATPEQRNRVKGWLKDAAVAQSKNLLFHILEAEIEDLAGAYDKAANVYRQILQKDKDNVIALNNLAFLLALKKENLAESLTMIDRAIDLAGPQAQLLDTKAVVLLQTGQPDKAVQEMQRAIAQGGSGEFYFHLAQAMLQAGKRDEAKVALGKAREAGMRAEQVHQLELPMFQALEAELAKT